MKILEIMRLAELELSHSEIAASANCGKTTVHDIKRRCREAGLTYAEALSMTNETIRARLYPLMSNPPTKDDPDWEELHSWLAGGKRRNLRYAWVAYRQGNPDGISYSQYCKRYAKWQESSGKAVTMAQHHEPGKELYVDWAGDTLDCVEDPHTGELHTAHFFVAVMGCSCYPYVEAFPNETSCSWLTAHINAFEHLGGVPQLVIPDNCKTAVTRPNHYDPELNPAYLELARHYGIAVIPARIKRPRDKSLVEGSIGWLETWLLEWLCGQRFFSFGELNRAISKRVAEMAAWAFKKRPGSRAGVFHEHDRPALRPLPPTRFHFAEYKTRRVPDNYHVEHDGFYYSVPYTLFRQEVTVRATATMVEVINANRERVALHRRRLNGTRYVTDKGHMPENHRRQLENSNRTGRDYLNWAATIGGSTRSVIDRMLKSQEMEVTAYRSCMGVLQLAKKHGPELLEAACAGAIAIGSPCYTTVVRLLKHPHAGKQPAPTPRHGNLRDPAEFV
jgi:transposase